MELQLPEEYCAPIVFEATKPAVADISPSKDALPDTSAERTQLEEIVAMPERVISGMQLSLELSSISFEKLEENEDTSKSKLKPAVPVTPPRRSTRLRPDQSTTMNPVAPR